MSAKKFSFIFILALTIFSFVLRLYRFEEPNRYYFDEVYHAVTAKAYADNNPAAYDPFAPAPKEGTAYDWLHPPLAKLIQAGSIKIFGDNPLGWRLPGAIFGTAIIPATFVLAFLLFGPVAAVFASTVIAFENLTFVMSRITMNDVFLTFFVIGAYIFTALYAKSFKFIHLAGASIFLGLSLSSKWPGLYAIGSIFLYVLFLQFKNKTLNFWPVLLIVIPIIFYVSSYGQFWAQGHTITEFRDLHKQIWWYQNRHDLEHSYGTTPLYCVPQGLNGPKTWCPWIFDIRGVYFSYEDYGSDMAGYIYALGNPLIFWVGIMSVSFLLGKVIEDKDRKIALVLLGYFIFWVPWIFSPRILFLYHYLPSLPFLAVSLGLVLSIIYKTRFKYISIVIVLVFIVVFFYLYPISSGLPLKISDIDKFMWLKTWR
ncbi:MAG: phospholipid carrier-dependent glycosyltransferase [Patescibacteria group bacterium]